MEEKKAVSNHQTGKDNCEDVTKFRPISLINTSYVADKCAKLIFSLSKSDKIHWGLKHEALTTIYNGAILPLLLYGAPVWIEAFKH